MLEQIPKLITKEENTSMFRLPDMEEVRKVVFELSGQSVAGPDGSSGQLFQKCWDIVKEDVTTIGKAFFFGQELSQGMQLVPI